MKTYLNIYGNDVQLTCEDPGLLQTLLEDLQTFQTSQPVSKSRQELIQLDLTALPQNYEATKTPAPFSEYQNIRLDWPHPEEKATLTRCATSNIMVINSFDQPKIQGAIVPDPALLPDPGFYYLFTHPINRWLKRRGLFPLHAGCVANRSGGILIAGRPKSGKSSLSVAAVRGGFQFLSDEQPLLSLQKKKVVAHAFPRRVRLDRTAADQFPELKPTLKTSSLNRIAFPMEKIRPNCLEQTTRPRILIFPSFQSKAKLWFDPIHPIHALGHLLQDDFFIWHRGKPWSEVSHQHLDLFTTLVEQTRAFRLVYGHQDLDRIPLLFEHLLDTYA